jgi:hypothetical protein
MHWPFFKERHADGSARRSAMTNEGAAMRDWRPLGIGAAKITKHIFGLVGGFFALWGFGFLYAAVFAPTITWPDATWWIDAGMAAACWVIAFAIWRHVLPAASK